MLKVVSEVVGVRKMEILFVDACPRERSRTRKLAGRLLQHLPGNKTALKLTEENIPKITEEVVNRRYLDGKKKIFTDPVYDMAKQFAQADIVVIAAPYWDMSFPALLKRYIEAITVTGITFCYSESGVPIGMCRAGKLYYVTTAGGPIINETFGYGYIKMLAQGMYGIPDCCCFKAENLDVAGANEEEILRNASDMIDASFEMLN